MVQTVKKHFSNVILKEIACLLVLTASKGISYRLGEIELVVYGFQYFSM